VAHRDVVVIGASAGGVEALRAIVLGLPPDFPATIFVVWHMPSHSMGLLPQIIEPLSALPVANAESGQPVTRGQIVIAPPDHHMILENSHVRLTQGPKENRFRPAVDPLFRSAAYAYGSRTIGVVLAGSLDDGTSGLWAIKDRGGVTVVQDPLDTLYPDMPRNAMRAVKVDYVLPAAEIPALLVDLVQEEVDPGEERGETSQALELGSAGMMTTGDEAMQQMGELSQHTCPECNGSLWRIPEGKILRFRCRTGHAYTSETLLEELTESIERGLWASVRGLEEHASLLDRIGQHLRQHGDDGVSEEYLRRSNQAREQARHVREAIEDFPRPRENDDRA
jgi:two-component system, chemotaxis family, protein-glutamate methylesterase/glutaminase